jgi:hypothetical protein
MADLIGFKNTTVRAAAILTTGYVAGTVLEGCEKFNVLSLNYDFTVGSLTDCQIKVEVSTNGTDYYQLVSDSITAGVNTVAGLVYKLTGTLKGATTPLSINTKYIKISAIGTGTVTDSSLKIDAILGKV